MACFVSLGARSMVAFATALAMLLPLPARCAACSTSAGNCPRCAATIAEHKTRSAERPCCKHSTATSDQFSHSDSARSLSHHSPRCGCGVSPLHRTVPPKDQLPAGHDFDAAPYRLFETSLEPRFATIAATRPDLPPPLPHRILHCSWLI
jgi:hypothetical protein